MPDVVTPAALTLDLVRAQVRRIQASAGFATAPTLCALLEYTVEKALRHQAEEIKETTLALEVFGRRTSFDPRSDPIVRVQARKLRERISTYYETQGTADEVLIEYVRGSYVPRFGSRGERIGPQQRSIAVLPFTNLSDTTALDYLCDGLTEEITYLLSRIHGLRVCSRTSAFSVRDSNDDIRTLARRLNADLLVTGSVRQAGDRVRITAHLIDSEDGYHLWSERWDRSTADLFQLQDEIAAAIGRALRPHMTTRAERAVSTHDLEAYHLFIKGRFYWNQRTEHGFQRAIEHYEAALSRDPRFARAHAALAETYTLIAAHHLDKPGECLLKARECATRAIALDPDLAAAHSALATTLLVHDRNPHEAEREWKVALDLDPQYAYAWHSLAVFGALVRPDSGESLRAIEKARRLDPLSAPICSDIAVCHYMSGRFKDAVEQCRAALDLHPGFHRTYVFLARSQAAMELYEEATATVVRSRSLFVGRAFLGQLLATLGYAWGRTGRTAEALGVIEELEESAASGFVAAIDLAIIYTGMGDADKAIEMLVRACEQREFWAVAMRVEPLLRPLHGHPRFRALSASLFPSSPSR